MTQKLGLKEIRRAGVPLAVVETNDPAATIRQALKDLGSKNGDLVILEYDLIRGMRGLNEKGTRWAQENGPEEGLTMGPPDWLLCLGDYNKLSCKGVIFWHQLDAIFEQPEGIQAIWNLRDVFKSNGWTFIGLSPSVTLPPMLRSDFILISEEAPNEKEVGVIVDKIVDTARKAGANIPEPYEDRDRAVDGLLGLLSGFDVEQTLSLSIGKEGVNLKTLWERKESMVSRTPGLTVWKGDEDFSKLAGCANIKKFLNQYLQGRSRPRCILFLDEIEKMVAGSAGDLSGTTQAMMEQFLSWTTDKQVDGIILLGVPGAGKSHTAKCMAGEAKIPCLQGSLSSVKGSLVGQSEGNMKAMLKTVDAIGQGRVLMIATCNGIQNLTPELMARFRLGTFFYDFPDEEERDALWKFYRLKYEQVEKAPESNNWVGREIEACCQIAWKMGISLKEAATYIVPVCKSAKAKMDALRQSVSGRFLSASYPGVYMVDYKPASEERKLEIE